MSTPNFRFKQFTVWHDRCAMKVGTDGVLLGAWCPVSNGRVLDVGTGSGLIALMLAQRCPAAQIDAIDIDAAAVEQARENFASSPWADRIHAYHISFQELTTHCQQVYGLIVSNPPYFIDSLKNPDAQRQSARHTDLLSYTDLLRCASRLLCEDGVLALILPAEAENEILAEAAHSNLFPFRLTHVYSKPGKPLKRIMVALRKNYHGENETADFFIESISSSRSTEYDALTKDFYLNSAL